MVMSGEGELVKDVFPWSEREIVDCPFVTVMSGEGESVKDVLPWSERGVADCPSVTIMSGEGELVKDVFPWSNCPSVEIHFELEKQGTK